jgi:hypothetical protein
MLQFWHEAETFFDFDTALYFWHMAQMAGWLAYVL